MKVAHGVDRVLGGKTGHGLLFDEPAKKQEFAEGLLGVALRRQDHLAVRPEDVSVDSPVGNRKTSGRSFGYDLCDDGDKWCDIECVESQNASPRADSTPVPVA